MGNFNPNKQSVMGLADSLIQFFNKGIKANNIADNAIITSLLANESVTKEKILQSSLKEWLESMFNESPVWFLPTGFPFEWDGSTPPAGAIERNGAELLRADYPALWEFANNSGNIVTDAEWAVGRQGSYSYGNGTTTFRIPDDRGVVIRGLDGGRGLDPGRVQGSYQADDNKAHDHPTLPNGKPVIHDIGGTGARYAAGSAVDTVTSSVTGTRGGPETRMKNNTKLFCIKT
jgi:hypothetical protein